MTPAERDRAVLHMERALAALKVMPVVTPCAKCLYFNADMPEHCGQWNARVPTEAQAVGCNKWEEDIPF